MISVLVREDMMRKRLLVAGILQLVLSSAALAQETDAGQIADSSVGRAGQRMNTKAQGVNAQPMTRINNRINSRIQLRIRNRIDRNYSAPSSSTSSFDEASSQIQRSNSGR